MKVARNLGIFEVTEEVDDDFTVAHVNPEDSLHMFKIVRRYYVFGLLVGKSSRIESHSTFMDRFFDVP